ncbi:hypothetical protein ABZ826_24120 [Streptomyces sp. NPDC047515]|uniref:hypothetical protein n=1 Tax=Streptomyces sp. NPDC047515 TaxID=3155380 RepID=UPI0033CDC4C8
MNAVASLALGTSGLVVVLNLGIGALALWSHRDGVRATERLIASGELDVYHAAWLIGPGYRRSAPWGREREAAETALRSLIAAGLVRLDEDARLVPSATTDQAGERPPMHPLALDAGQFTFDSWSTGHPVTVRALTAHPLSKRPVRLMRSGCPATCRRTARGTTTAPGAHRWPQG